MDILIKNMEMPKKGQRKFLIIDDNCQVSEFDGHYSFITTTRAIKIPPHGRLGDLDLVEEWMRKKHKENDCPFNIDAFLFALKKFPTILEANNGTDN